MKGDKVIPPRRNRRAISKQRMEKVANKHGKKMTDDDPREVWPIGHGNVFGEVRRAVVSPPLGHEPRRSSSWRPRGSEGVCIFDQFRATKINPVSIGGSHHGGAGL